MTINEIYNEYNVGSAGFIAAVQTHCGLGISDEEIERIAARAKSGAEFMKIWENTDWWTDANNQ